MALMQFLLDGLVAVLLAVTMLRAMRLERALSAVRRERGGLEQVLGGFAASTREAQGGIERLQDAAHGTVRRLEQHTGLAQSLAQDLAFLVERAGRVAGHLDGAVRQSRDMADAPALRRPAMPLESGTHDLPVRSQAERDLLAALRGGR